MAKVCPICRLQYDNAQNHCFVDNAVLETLADPWIGQTLAGRYLIEENIGEGGMASVYRARHTLVDRPVAVKIMSESLAQNDSLRERFRREAKNAAALAHPNVIEIHDFGELDNGSVFLVMELLVGASLGDHIAHGPIAPDRAITLALQMGHGLARAHDFDVIHRDLKPDNIFICGREGERERVKLLDFGIARSMHDSRLTSAGEIFGTPQYMAPERITSIDAGPSADLYALGVIFFEMVTGRLPFESEEMTGFFLKHMNEPPPKPTDFAPNCPRRFEELILALLAKKVEDRPVDAHQLIKELQAMAPKEELSIAPIGITPSKPVIAPTLPPTTLERWAKRADLFAQMLRQAYPHGAPPTQNAMLEEIRTKIREIHANRSGGLKVQRSLEELEGEARENRERLGFAVHSLGEDLSLAREAARDAGREVNPYMSADENARAAYLRAHQTLEAEGGYHEVSEPSVKLPERLREIAEAMERWSLARASAAKAEVWVASKRAAVEDLEFQVKALRDQLARTETEQQKRRESIEASLVARGQVAQDLERALNELATRFCEQLRGVGSLRPYFEQLAAEG